MGDMIRIANWLFVNGVNLINPHAFYLSTEGFRKNECPPSQFIQAPYWKEYGRFADYIRRVSYVMSQGVHSPDVAVYYPSLSLLANYNLSLLNAATNLLSNELEYIHILLGMLQKDYDFMDEEMLKNSVCKNGVLEMGKEKYAALIMPCTMTLSRELIEKLQELRENNLRVLFTTTLPYQYIDGGAGAEKLELFGLDASDVFSSVLKFRIPFLPLYHFLFHLLGRMNFERVLMRFPLLSFTRVYKEGNWTFLRTTCGLSPSKRNASVLERLLGKQNDPRIEKVKGDVRNLRLIRRRMKEGKLYFIANIASKNVTVHINFSGDASILHFDSGETSKCPSQLTFAPFEAKGFFVPR